MLSFLFFFYYSAAHRDLHSFPTRRSSDLRKPGDIELICSQFQKVYDVYVTTSRAIEREAKNRGISHIRHIRWACNTPGDRSEEHTSELQSHSDLVCRLLLEKKKKQEQ